MIEELRLALEDYHSDRIVELTPVKGGDINLAFRYACGSRMYFVKANRVECMDMFTKESDALNFIGSQKIISTPEVIELGKSERLAYLILAYIDPDTPTQPSWQDFGHKLAQLHRVSADSFGWKQSNYIGSLVQHNEQMTSWAEFYAEQRLLPLIKHCRDAKLLHSVEMRLAMSMPARLHDICPSEPPSLIHGDLWNGNFICSEKQTPYLIDPSISFAHREMDIAMTLLFGGFSPHFYDSYQDTYPLFPGWSSRLDIYQLYYLLVHLRLFGSSYHQQVMRIVRKYA